MEAIMWDIVYLGLGSFLFVALAGYVHLCDRI